MRKTKLKQMLHLFDSIEIERSLNIRVSAHLVFHTLMKQNKFNGIDILTYRSLYKKIETTHFGQ